MNLTNLQRVNLKILRKNRQHKPTVLLQFWSFKFELLTMACLTLLGYSIAPYEWMRCLLPGFFAGFLWAIFGVALGKVRFWPVMSEIVNWAKVEELIAETEDHNA
jgi:hypothetical protein